MNAAWLHVAGALLVVTLGRGLPVFIAALAVTALVKKLSGETRHVIWLGVILSFLLIPLAWLLLPGVRLNPWIAIHPASALRLVAAPALSRGGFVMLVEQSRKQVALLPAPALPASDTRLPTLLLGMSLAPVAIWAFGILALAARLALGRWRLRQLAAGAQCDARLQALAASRAGELGRRRRVSVQVSPLCRIPFSFGIRRPTVLLPTAAARWPAGRLNGTLTHELAHIGRRDLVVQTIGYAVCILFWFIAPLWLAYAAMLREAETCCDQQVINRGIRGPEYAQGIVELARSCEGRILLPSISSAIGRKSMLKQRIKRVLELKPARRPFRVRSTARVLAVCLACVAPVLALSAQARPLLLQPADPLFGTWVNAAYESSSFIRESASRIVLASAGSEFV